MDKITQNYETNKMKNNKATSNVEPNPNPAIVGKTTSTATPIANLPTIPDKLSFKNDKFWLQDPNILFYSIDFFPSSSMSLNQKLNAITRAILAFTIIGIIVTPNPLRLIFISFICILGVIAMYKYYNKEGFFDNSPNIALDTLAEYNPAEVLRNNEIPIFQEPDSKNPYGNVMLTDYESNPNKLPAPPASNPIVNDIVTANAIKMVKEANPGQPDITDKLFRDLNEQINFEQSNRMFVSNPSTTIPNDQGAFAEFCYGSMISCKEGNLFACARNTSHYTNY